MNHTTLELASLSPDELVTAAGGQEQSFELNDYEWLRIPQKDTPECKAARERLSLIADSVAPGAPRAGAAGTAAEFGLATSAAMRACRDY